MALRRFTPRRVSDSTSGLQDHGVTLGAGLGVGDGDGCVTRGNLRLCRSELLIVKVPSRPSTLAYHVPSLAGEPTINRCDVLWSAEFVKARVSCGFSKPSGGLVAPSHSAACKLDNVLS